MHHHILWSGPLGRITGQVTVKNMYCYFYTRNVWKLMRHQVEATVRADNENTYRYCVQCCAILTFTLRSH